MFVLMLTLQICHSCLRNIVDRHYQQLHATQEHVRAVEAQEGACTCATSADTSCGTAHAALQRTPGVGRHRDQTAGSGETRRETGADHTRQV